MILYLSRFSARIATFTTLSLLNSKLHPVYTQRDDIRWNSFLLNTMNSDKNATGHGSIHGSPSSGCFLLISSHCIGCSAHRVLRPEVVLSFRFSVHTIIHGYARCNFGVHIFYALRYRALHPRTGLAFDIVSGFFSIDCNLPYSYWNSSASWGQCR